jgi:hypothetical protein
MTYNLQGLTGLPAIVAELVHTIWISLVLLPRDERRLFTFSYIIVSGWMISLVPYSSPVFFAMR